MSDDDLYALLRSAVTPTRESNDLIYGRIAAEMAEATRWALDAAEDDTNETVATVISPGLDSAVMRDLAIMCVSLLRTWPQYLRDRLREVCG